MKKATEKTKSNTNLFPSNPHKASLQLQTNHKDLWFWLAAHPKADKKDWPPFQKMPEKEIPVAFCYPCEQASNNKKGNKRAICSCDDCPIKNWGNKAEHCIVKDHYSPKYKGSYYDQWFNTENVNTRKAMALKIANLPWQHPED